jgi:hypothetical protein
MLRKVRAEPLHIARIHKIDGPTERAVLDALVVWEAEIGPIRFRDVSAKPGPARESVLARDRELRVAQGERRLADRVVRRRGEARVKLANALARLATVRALGFLKVSGLVLEVIEARVGWQLFRRHDELPFVARPDVRKRGQKVSSLIDTVWGWTSVLSADWVRPLRRPL